MLRRPSRGLGVLAALLLATLALAVLSVQAVRREALVRTRLIVETHRSIADLVGARLDAAMAQADRGIAADLQASDPEAEALLTKLQGIEAARPWLQPLVLISRGRVTSDSPSADRNETGAGQPVLPTSRFRERQVASLAASVHALSAGAALLSGTNGDKDEDQGAVRYFATGDDRDVVMAVMTIRNQDKKGDASTALVAHEWGASNVAVLFERLLSEHGPWSEVGLALVGSSTQPAFSSITPVPDDAARATVALARAPHWRVAAFPKSGSLGALAVRDVTRYAGLLILVFGTVVTALLLAARSVSRELALSRLRADFVASVSHELKTPLSLIRMFAESLREGWVPEDKRAEYYDVITHESERLTGLINNVLDFSRIESGTRKYQLARTDLRALLADLLNRYRFHLKATNIELVEDLPPDPVYACVDREAIEQVILNLLSNAMKYMGDIDRQPRQIRVSLCHNSGWVSMRIADTGIGMSARSATRSSPSEGPIISASSTPACPAQSRPGLSQLRHQHAPHQHGHGGPAGSQRRHASRHRHGDLRVLRRESRWEDSAQIARSGLVARHGVVASLARQNSGENVRILPASGDEGHFLRSIAGKVRPPCS